MTGVEKIARIRFEHYQNGKGIKRIARELGIARDTVRKVLRSGATEFTYKREIQPQPKPGAWVTRHARPSHASLRYHRDRKRKLALQNRAPKGAR